MQKLKIKSCFQPVPKKKKKLLTKTKAAAESGEQEKEKLTKKFHSHPTFGVLCLEKPIFFSSFLNVAT